MLNEQTWHQQLLQGNDEALDFIIKQHYNDIVAFTYRYCADYHLAYDLTQETFIKMVRHIHSLKKTDQLRQWLFKIALNTCRDYFKRKSSQLIRTELEYIDGIAEQASQTEDLLEKSDNALLVQQLLQHLPAYQREAIILRFYYDMKLTEIAEVTDADLSTVKSRLKQGIEKLKKFQEQIRGERSE